MNQREKEVKEQRAMKMWKKIAVALTLSLALSAWGESERFPESTYESLPKRHERVYCLFS